MASAEKLRSRRDFLITALPTAVIIAAAFSVTLYFVKPAPPDRIVLATTADEGGSRYFARRYQKLLEKHGVTLELRSTQGSVSNIRLLADDDSGVDVAFVQSGNVKAEEAPNVVSLGSLTYTPLWIFYRGEPIDDVAALKGRRINVGPEESGTRALAQTLLRANEAEGSPTQLLSLGREEAIEALKNGEIDALFMVSPAESPAIRKLATAPGVRLMSSSRADAYVRRFPYLSKLTLPRGTLNLASDVPERDVVLLSPTANLVARDDLHPALAYLLMRAASEVHGSAGLLDQSNEFPAAREAGFPLSSEAERFYEAGVPLLQRYLPFWIANLVDRLWVMLVPLIAVVVPLGRAVPSLYRWRVRSRVFKWYARLKELEIQLDDDPNPALDKLGDMLRRLEEIENAVNHIPTPLAYAENLYAFRTHVDVVRRRLLRMLEESPHEKPAAAKQSA